uniref:SKI/SNO/DAC domain-containing protein n=1 Tax=Amphiprion percula TaxID=161767 RepID=A0A3P8RZU2_AMPPE
MAGSSTPPTDPLLHSDPPYSAPNPSGSSRLPAARLSGAFLSGGIPVSGGGASPQTECRMVEVHGLKVASFTVNGAELICLPQVFDLFLKHLVGGLHTVYTKLKRLDIRPVVCTPGVNRCKLISRTDFETLYRDCTNASSRPGRPPKRTLGVATMKDGSRLLPHSLLSPALLSQTGLTAAMAEALKLQKMRMMMGFHGNSDQHSIARYWPTVSHSSPLIGHLCQLSIVYSSPSVSTPSGLSDLPFMVMPHPLLPMGLPPASVAMAMNHLTNMAAVSQVQTDESKVSVTYANSLLCAQESLMGSPSPCPSPSDDELHRQEPTSQSPSRASSSFSSSPPPPAHTPELGEITQRNNDSLLPLPLLKPTYEKLALTSQPLSISHTNTFAPFLLAEGLSSMETLLTNIQGLLKVALESVRCQDQQNQLERKELKLELDRERDARQALQRHLSSELHSRGETGETGETPELKLQSRGETGELQRVDRCLCSGWR